MSATPRNAEQLKAQIKAENPGATLEKWEIGAEPLVVVQDHQLPPLPTMAVNMDFADGSSILRVDNQVYRSKDDFIENTDIVVEKIMVERKRAGLNTRAVGPAICFYLENLEQFKALQAYINADIGSSQEIQAFYLMEKLNTENAIVIMNNNQMKQVIKAFSNKSKRPKPQGF